MTLLAEPILQDFSQPESALHSNAGGRDAFRLTVGIVNEIATDQYTVIDILPHMARRAASCSTRPEVGDSVLIAKSEAVCWIVAVLVAAGERSQDLIGPIVHVKAGKLSLNAETLKSSSKQWQATHGNVELTAGETRASVGLVEFIGQKLISCFDVCYARNRRVLREVSEIESVKCAAYDLRVSETMLLSAENSVITSQALTKLDGAQVQVG